MTLDYKKLQNGSDIRGVAIDGVSGEPVNLGKEEAFRITRGFLLWLMDRTKKEPQDITVSIGHDSRISADFLKTTLIDTLIHIGVKTIDCGLSSTPAMFMSTIFDKFNCDGAVMITASHLPYNRNGFKFFTKDGGLEKKDISDIIAYAQSEIVIESFKVTDTPDTNPVSEMDLIGAYSEFLKNKIKTEVSGANFDRPLDGMKIVVDAGNGAGGFFAEKILKPLGADISGSQFLEPDGTFPNHPPNPENSEAMKAISEAVLANNADLGLIFDTDVDRSAAVDKDGREISRNAIVALAAALIAREHPGTTVVTDSITSVQLTEYLEKCLGLKHLRFKRGYRNVINKSVELNEQGIDSQLAIETSGHAAYKENYFLDDGAYLATKIVIKAAQLRAYGETIDCMIRSLEEPKEAIEIRLPISASDFSQYADRVLDGLKAWAAEREAEGISIVEPNYEGIRLNFDMNIDEKKKHEIAGSEKNKRKSNETDEKESADGRAVSESSGRLVGWCLLRKSLHDPIMPLNIEVSEGECGMILNMIKGFFADYECVDI